MISFTSLVILFFIFLPNLFQPNIVFAALNSPQIISVSPSSPSPVGTCITVRAKVQWDGEFRSMRMRFGNEGWQEESTPEFSRTFCTGNYSPGWYKIRVEVAKVGDNSWSNPAFTEANYQLTQSQNTQQEQKQSQPSSPNSGPGFVDFSLNPSSGIQVGQSIQVHIKVNSSNPGAIRIYVPCGNIAHFEHTIPEYTTSWSTSGCGSGTQTIRACSRDVNDNNWQNPTCVNKSVQFSSPPSSPNNPPKANFWVDDSTIIKGSCTVLHWQSSDASRVDIDGEVVSLSGQKKVCPTVTKHYSLKAVGSGGESTRSLSVVVSLSSSTNTNSQSSSNQQNSSPQTNVNSIFKNGDIIIIGYDIYVISNGQRRLVPNPQTLDALGISRTWINNKGLNEAQLLSIPRGMDIPDANKDANNFRQYSNQIKPAIQSNQNITSEIVESNNSASNKNSLSEGIPVVIIQSKPIEETNPSIFDRVWDFLKSKNPINPPTALADDNRFTGTYDPVTREYKGQCTYCAANWSNASSWLPSSDAHAKNWDEYARAAEKPVSRYLDVYANSIAMQFLIRDGDILVWNPPNCEGVDADYGHVAIIRGFDFKKRQLLVDDCNWYKDLRQHKGMTHPFLPCMSIIHVGNGKLLLEMNILPPELQVHSTPSSNIINQIFNSFLNIFKTK